MARGNSTRSRCLWVRSLTYALLLALLVPTSLGAQGPNSSRLPSSPGSAVDGSNLSSSNSYGISRLPPIEQPKRLGLASIERLALANNPSIARAFAGVEAARGDWLQGGLYPNPTVGIGQQQTGSRGLAEQDNVAFSQEFVLGGKLRLNREMASKQLSQAQYDLAAQQLRVLTDARIAFYHTLIAQRQRQRTAELVEVANRGVEAALKRDKGTDVGGNDVLEARIELHTAEIEVRRATNRHAASWRSLCAMVGVRELAFQELEGDYEQMLPARSWQGEVATTLRSSPEVGASVAGFERAQSGLARAEVQKIPNVTFGGLVNWRDNGIGGRPDGGFLISVPLPIWDRNQGGVRRARSEVIAAEQAIEQLELELQNRLAPIFERYENAHYQVTQYRDLILPAAAKALMLTRKNYEAGLVDYDDLLTSQRTNARANIDYLDALREFWIADAELNGMTLSGSLTALPSR